MNSPHEQTATAPSFSLNNTVSASLLERRSLSMRVGAFARKRREMESRYRARKADLDELAPVIWWRGIGMAALRLLLKGLRLYDRGRANAMDLRLVEQRIAIPGLPGELDGFRILQLSDLHLPRRFPAFAEKAGHMLDGLEVDMCVLTGDYRYGYYGPTDHVPRQLHTILSGVKSRHGVVAILGNHDTLISGECIEAAGIPILFNEGLALREGAATLWLCGIDDPHIYGCDCVEDAVRDAPEDAFIVLLAHTPERIAEAEAAGVSLYLAGHTHGGQIRLPGLGAVTTNAACSRDQAGGLWRYGRMAGFTTAGLGTTDLPVRFNCPPEAVVIELTREH